jgi:hypothetical protein
MTTYHRVACTEGLDAFRPCAHTHATVVSAAACISSAGEYVVAQENGVFRALTRVEEVEYEYAIYGRVIDRSMSPLEGFRKKRFT